MPSPHKSAPVKDRPKWWEPYFAALAECGVKRDACAAAGVDRTTPDHWLARNATEKIRAEFNRREAEALEQATQKLEREAVRRASEGTDEPVFYKGRPCGSIRKYSDTLLIFLLKARRPETYRDRVDHRIEDPDGVLAKVLGVTPEALPT